MNKLHFSMPQYEAIKKAYGRFFLDSEKHIDEFGWISDQKAHDRFFREIDCDTSDAPDAIYLRPIELDGLENNNGWTKIKTIQDLPQMTTPRKAKNLTRYQAAKGERVYNAPVNVETLKKWFLQNRVTHYMELPPKPEPPIY